jgi:tripartite-type tricarboxylate transporter receptor subunit TctC
MGSLGPITTAPLVQRTPYDVERTSLPVAMFGLSSYVLAVNTTSRRGTSRNSWPGCGRQPGLFTYATVRHGAAAHLITLMMLSRLKVDTVHVPFQGSGRR